MYCYNVSVPNISIFPSNLCHSCFRAFYTTIDQSYIPTTTAAAGGGGSSSASAAGGGGSAAAAAGGGGSSAAAAGGGGAALLLLAADGRGAALHLTESIETKCKDLVFTFFVLSKQSVLVGG